MFYSRISDDMINKVHERAMRVILIDHESGFETFKHSWSKFSKIKKNSPLIRGFLKEEIILTNVRNFQEFETERKRTASFRS